MDRAEIPETHDEDNYYRDKLDKAKTKFFKAMDNDFNTPDALSTIFNFIRDINRGVDDKNISQKVLQDISGFFMDIEMIFGINFTDRTSDDDRTDDLLQLIVEVREKLRERKDWELADSIRTKLKELNINLEDK